MTSIPRAHPSQRKNSPDTPGRITQSLNRLVEGRTVITIAHRLSTLRQADRILVIDDGVVVENGSHHDLLTRNGIYAELHRLQFGHQGLPGSRNAL